MNQKQRSFEILFFITVVVAVLGFALYVGAFTGPTAAPPNNANQVIFQSGSKVGFGTTTPQHKLSVVGSIYSVQYNHGNSGSSFTIDWNNGNTQHVILTANATITFSNGQPGGRYTLILKQDSVGGRTVTWPTNVRWADNTAPILTTTANKTDYVGFIYNGIDAKYDGVAFNANF